MAGIAAPHRPTVGPFVLDVHAEDMSAAGPDEDPPPRYGWLETNRLADVEAPQLLAVAGADANDVAVGGGEVEVVAREGGRCKGAAAAAVHASTLRNAGAQRPKPRA